MASGALIALIVVVGVALVVLVSAGGYLLAKERREEGSAFAAAHGWTWTERDDRWSERFDDDPFGNGFFELSDPAARNAPDVSL